MAMAMVAIICGGGHGDNGDDDDGDDDDDRDGDDGDDDGDEAAHAAMAMVTMIGDSFWCRRRQRMLSNDLCIILILVLNANVMYSASLDLRISNVHRCFNHTACFHAAIRVHTSLLRLLELTSRVLGDRWMMDYTCAIVLRA